SAVEMTLRPIFLPVLALATLAGVAACDRPPSAESLKDWTPTDHHSTDDDKAASGAQGPMQPAQAAAQAGPAPGNGGGDNSAQLIDLTWRNTCAACHGMSGRGDGQMGPMVQAPDLTRADWQSGVTDAQMFATIKTGKNKMPRF